MANVQHPGFLPCGYGTGGTVTYVRRRALTNNTDPIGLQDAVIAVNDGNITSPGVSSTRATLVDSVAMGVSYVNANGERIGAKNLPAATLYTSSGVNPDNATYVTCVENAVLAKFRASVDAAVTLTNLRNNCEIILGTPVNGLSVQELKGSTLATTATLPIRMIEFIFAADNDVDAADAHVYCAINQGQSEPALTVDGLGV